MSGYETLPLGDQPLTNGGTLKNAHLAYQTYGTLNTAGDNVVVMPTFYTGTHARNQGFFGPGVNGGAILGHGSGGIVLSRAA